VDRRHRLGDPADTPVLGDGPEDIRREPGPLEHSDGSLPDDTPVLGVDDVHGGHPEEFFPGIAPVIGGMLVDEPEDPVLDHVDAHEGTVFQGPEEAFLEDPFRLQFPDLFDVAADFLEFLQQAGVHGFLSVPVMCTYVIIGYCPCYVKHFRSRIDGKGSRGRR